MKRLFLFTFLLIYGIASSMNEDTIKYLDSNKIILIGKYLQIMEDETNMQTFNDVKSSLKFKKSDEAVPNFGVTNSSVWIKFKIKNGTNNDKLLLELANPIIDEVEFYSVLVNGSYAVKKMGEYKSFEERDYNHPSYIFDIRIPKDSTFQFYLKVRCREQLTLPLNLSSPTLMLNSLSRKDLLFGIYFGIMLAMFFYNAFIFFTTKDKIYLYYIIYILFVGLTQSCFQGYTFQFLWYNSPWMVQHSVIILSALVGISAAEFARVYLNAKTHLKYFNKVIYVFYASYIIAVTLSIFGKNTIPIIDLTALSISLYLLIIAIIIVRRGYRPAKYFLIAWIVFLIGVIVFALKNMGILPYNNITIYTMPTGSAIEAILLSFALADRINILKKEKEESQAKALEVSQQNEKLITEKKVELEKNVEERTIELKKTLNNLKDTQAQLVNAEKMASLGQLTAGIAHEINNPINFVSANVKPLKLDIDDIMELIKKYESISPSEASAQTFKEINEFRKTIDIDYLKKEMEALLAGIEDGAKRTADIVSGLKNFSRLDESDIKEANINEGIESTLILLKSAIPPNTEVIKNLGDLPYIECLPGKLNQVFMNLFSNALYAIGRKTTREENKLIISSYVKDDKVHVSIEDTGIGMTPEVMNKMFDPFFTTKDVGEGTGLGMSIVFKIIESHGAKIEVNSEYGVGTKILLILNKKINAV
ncbi:MAG: ATPase [Bacteroidetes bacterium]|nr:ATPase [Bacteroidota bacterium]